MDFVYNSPNGFAPSNVSHVPMSSYMDPNANAITMPSPHQWQTPNNLPIWTHNVPNVMPWTNVANSGYPNSNSIVSPNSFLPTQSQQTELYSFQDSAPIPSQPLTLPNCSIPSTSSSFLYQNNFNFNNKRQMNTIEDDIDVDFDFDNKRPVKKYICEDKVLEIFDRLHIREGEHYIVEDASEEEQVKPNTDFKHNVVIEVLEDDENDYILELSPELRKAFQNNNTSITDKLLENEKDKISKAVVLWQPNSILQSLLPSLNDDVDNDRDRDEGNEVKIEEFFSDEDEEMFNCENDVLIEQIKDDDELME